MPVCVENRFPRHVGLYERTNRPSECVARFVGIGDLRQFVVVVNEHVLDRQVRNVERHLVLERKKTKVVKRVRKEFLGEELRPPELGGEIGHVRHLSLAPLDVVAQFPQRSRLRLRKATEPADVCSHIGVDDELRRLARNDKASQIPVAYRGIVERLRAGKEMVTIVERLQVR